MPTSTMRACAWLWSWSWDSARAMALKAALGVCGDRAGDQDAEPGVARGDVHAGKPCVHLLRRFVVWILADRGWRILVCTLNVLLRYA